MRQTLAIFLDQLRELRAKKLFWITLIISLVVVLSFAAIGIDTQGLTFLWFHIDIGPFNVTSDIIPPATLYKNLFYQFGIDIWLTWVAAILGLVSTASIFPTLLKPGHIDVTLSKPISRTRLFLTKYTAGLLFVALQVTVFSVACFLILGIRGNEWLPQILLAIPIVTLFFSYLFAISALLGTLTRSTIAALMLTLLAWFMIFLVTLTETSLLANKLRLKDDLTEQQHALSRYEQRWQDAINNNPNGSTAQAHQRYRKNVTEAEQRLTFWSRFYTIAHTTRQSLPKTTQTIQTLERLIYTEQELARLRDSQNQSAQPDSFSRYQLKASQLLADQPLILVIGTSLWFEAILLAFAIWRFNRRDF